MTVLKQNRYRLVSMAIFGCICLLASCMSYQTMMDKLHGHYYKYTFGMQQATTHKKSSKYANKRFAIAFYPNYSRIKFTLSNKTNAPIKIVWNKAAIVTAIDSSAVINSNIAYVDKDNTKPNTTVAAKATYEDIIVPTKYIVQEGGKWKEKDFYPESDQSNPTLEQAIMRSIGTNLFTLYLPIQINGKTTTYKFTFYPYEIEKGAKSFKK